MGIRGLKTFIEKNNSNLKQTTISNCYVVIDGNNVAAQLFRTCPDGGSAFGGDYKEYATHVDNFFSTLKNANITAFVLFDGSHDLKKLKTIEGRCISRLHVVRKFYYKGYSEEILMPMFMLSVFRDVLNKLEIISIQCEFEADHEIAALARLLNCPVISDDSDFYISNVKCIPFSKIQFSGQSMSDGVMCCLFELSALFTNYPGMNAAHLPLLSVLLGNDYTTKDRLLEKFFASLNFEITIGNTIEWLRHETETSAVQKIVQYLQEEEKMEFDRMFEFFKKNCNDKPVCEVTEVNGKFCLSPPKFKGEMPRQVELLLRSGNLHSFVTNLIYHRNYIVFMQIEDLRSKTCHIHSIPILLAIDRLVTPNIRDRDVKIFMRNKHVVEYNIFTNELQHGESLEILLNSSVNKRIDYLNEVLGLDKNISLKIEGFHPKSQLFLTCLLYWIKASKPFICNIYALLLTYIGCQAANENSLERGFTDDDASKLTEILKSFHGTRHTARQNYKIYVVHAFNVFQSILSHFETLNIILGKPLPHFDVLETLNGTLNYNICDWISNEPNALRSIQLLLQSVPSVWKYYEDIYQSLCSDMTDGLQFRPTRKRYEQPREGSERPQKYRRIRRSSSRNKNRR